MTSTIFSIARLFFVVVSTIQLSIPIYPTLRIPCNTMPYGTTAQHTTVHSTPPQYNTTQHHTNPHNPGTSPVSGSILNLSSAPSWERSIAPFSTRRFRSVLSTQSTRTVEQSSKHHPNMSNPARHTQTLPDGIPHKHHIHHMQSETESATRTRQTSTSNLSGCVPLSGWVPLCIY